MVTVGFERRGAVLLSMLFGVVIALLPLSGSAAQKVVLAWQPSPDPNVAGYSVYYGLASGAYSGKVSVTNSTSATISGLTEGLTYFFAVTAFTSSGVESLPSNEVSYVVPGVRLTIKPTHLPGFSQAFNVASTGVVPYPWVLEATENFKSWRALFRGTNSAVNVTVFTVNTPALFFRLKRQ
jgi:hypothetical protein